MVHAAALAVMAAPISAAVPASVLVPGGAGLILLAAS
jgi:hypothetical protein